MANQNNPPSFLVIVHDEAWKILCFNDALDPVRRYAETFAIQNPNKAVAVYELKHSVVAEVKPRWSYEELIPTVDPDRYRS